MTISRNLQPGLSVHCQKFGDDASVVRHMKRQARDWRCRPLDVGAAIAHDVRKGMARCRRKVLNYGYKGWNGR